MFPIRDHNPSNKTPFVTYALIAINVLVFLSYLPRFGDDMQIMSFFLRWGMVPQLLTQGDGGWLTLVTSMFLHGGWLHLGGNMLFLWIFGDNLEEEFGHGGFLLFYLACGIGAALWQYATAPMSPVPVVGASGAIAGVMGGYLLLFPRARVDILLIIIIFFRIITVPAWVMLGIWFGLQLMNGVMSDATMGGIAYWAHAGGFIVGFAATLPLWLRRGGPGFWRRTKGLPPHPEARYRQSGFPRIPRR
ncbi:rhomboid family intramembrane serine protease [Plastorhodobacter daqingensis]|uniref:Rhomboid family intramembrane serine protease n=1 Tax=Plastorhodobacter daqingensis TaxID=1387281 RepID=A0ABW2UFN0_9RHOB